MALILKNELYSVDFSFSVSEISTFLLYSDTLNVPTKRPKKATIESAVTTDAETPATSTASFLLFLFFTYSSSYISVCVLEGGAR